MIPVKDNRMIPLEKQVVSLELSRRLKALGIKQDSMFYWEDHPSFLPVLILRRNFERYEDKTDYYSAFTVAELGQLLPRGFRSSKSNVEDFIIGWKRQVTTPDKSEADARARMLACIAEKKSV